MCISSNENVSNICTYVTGNKLIFGLLVTWRDPGKDPGFYPGRLLNISTLERTKKKNWTNWTKQIKMMRISD